MLSDLQTYNALALPTADHKTILVFTSEELLVWIVDHDLEG
jgi:hypothetical protein